MSGILSLLNVITAVALSLNTLSAGFERAISESNKKDVTRGSIYYQAESRTIMKIDFPINQILIFSKNNLQVYYPEKKSAIILKSESPFPVPFFYNFLGVLKEDFGLSNIGYRLTRHEIKDNILYTHWVLSSEGKKNTKNHYFILGTKKNMIVSTESRNSKGELSSKTEFKNHIQFNNYFFPTEILSKYYHKTGTSKERVTFSNIRFNGKIPDAILNFQVPSDAKVEEIQL